METIDRERAKALVQDREQGGVSIIEVLSPESFAKFHLPGAKNVPFDEDFDEHIQQAIPDKSRPVLVYCMDSECDASPKAAQHMDELGYSRVYDYEAGKVDWKEAGLQIEE